ncbi:hypothetical protein TUM4630_23920 [Shewanella algidipiscicola]|uniref:Uncharacterized protein n=1 Tax=Shewanella algidipiscicola TaxID=614070 RepID=A0ABQ4PK51_9GAMM|nr:hypothetical protein TUM4630_23920 [Shewanella algidipiscicola]
MSLSRCSADDAFAASAKYCEALSGALLKDTWLWVSLTGGVEVAQPNNTVDKTAIKINLVVFSLFNTGLHSGKMLAVV